MYSFWESLHSMLKIRKPTKIKQVETWNLKKWDEMMIQCGDLSRSSRGILQKPKKLPLNPSYKWL